MEAAASRRTLGADLLTPEVLLLIARALDRAQRTRLRPCGKLLRSAANESINTLVLTPLLLKPGRYLKLLNTSFQRASRVLFEGFSDADYTWFASHVDLTAFFGRIKEVDLLDSACSDLFLCVVLDVAKSLECLRAHVNGPALCKLEHTPSLATLKDLELAYTVEHDQFPSLAFLSNLVKLNSLSVNANLRTDILSTLPTTLTALTSLHLSNGVAVAIDLGPLQALTSLKTLDTWTCCSVRLFEQLLQLTHLDSIILQLRVVAEDAPGELAALLPRLSELRNLVELVVPEDSEMYAAGEEPQECVWTLPDGLTRLAVLDKLCQGYSSSSVLKVGVGLRSSACASACGCE